MDSTDANLDESRDSEQDAVPRSGSAWRRTRFNIATILISTGCVLVVIWLVIIAAITAERHVAVEHARSEANNLSAAFQEVVTDKLGAITRLMDAIDVRMRSDPDFDLHAWVRERPLWTAIAMGEITILSPDGTLLSTTREPHPAPVNLSDRAYFRVQVDGHLHQPYLGPLIVGRLSHQPHIVVSRRIEAADGRFLGVLAYSLAPSRLVTLNRSIDIGPHGLLMLFGTDNIIRVRFSHGAENGELGAGMQLPPLPISLSDGAPTHSFIRESMIDHVVRLYSVRDVPGYPLYVSVAFDLNWALQPAAAHADLVETEGAIATLVLCAMIVLLFIETLRRAGHEVRLEDQQVELVARIRHGNQVQEKLRSSEVRLRDFAEMASDWFWAQDTDLRFTAIGIEAPDPDQVGLSYMGKRRWEVADTSQAPEKWANHQRDLLAHKPFRDFRYSRLGPDGEMHHLSINGVPVYDDAGRFAGYRGTGHEITKDVVAELELRQAKERAEQAETLLRDAVDSVSEGFVIYDREDRFVMCNQNYRQIYAENAALLVPGASFEDIVRRAAANNGGHHQAQGHDGEWLAERLRHHREASGAIEQCLANGSWILVTDRRMKNGGIVGLRIDITALKQAQAALYDSQERLERAQEIANVGSWELDVASGQYVWSRQLYRIRRRPDDFQPTRLSVAGSLHPDDTPTASQWLADLVAGRERRPIEVRDRGPNGELRVLRIEGRSLIGAGGTVHRLAGTIQDVTELRLIQRQLLQAQKMEAIGGLTGGLAHDFNNVLGIIIGNLELLLPLIGTDAAASELCDEALDGAGRCADLIRRLLAFARRQPLRPERIDANALISEVTLLLGRTLGEGIMLNLVLDPALWPVTADHAQLEAALVNLATNARDAMPKGGKLDVVTRNVELDASYAELYPGVRPGAYGLIEVSDTGTGIAPEIIGQIFEPFFTTKGQGKGTGLGLSMAYGFAQQSGGHLAVFSEPGLGATFRLYLPRSEHGAIAHSIRSELDPMAGGEEIVLVVEDNAQLRRTVALQLADLGYHVWEAEHAEAALRILTDRDQVDLLFSDVMMPGAMDGLDLAAQATLLRPGLRVLLTSGFLGVHATGTRMYDCHFPLLSKPYRRDDLARAVREALNRAAAGRQPASVS
jgi:signal transduction histidine kinase/CheY-like chemotaxis protein